MTVWTVDCNTYISTIKVINFICCFVAHIIVFSCKNIDTSTYTHPKPQHSKNIFNFFFLNSICLSRTTYQLNQTFRDISNIGRGRSRSINVYFLPSSTVSTCFSFLSVRPSNISSVNATSFVIATFLIISFASSTLFLDNNQRTDSGTKLKKGLDELGST